MFRLKKTILATALLTSMAPTASRLAVAAPTGEELERLLLAGNLADSEQKLAAMLASEQADDNVRLALGSAKFLRGLERLMQSLYRYGLKPVQPMGMPIVRLPVPNNPTPVPLTNDAFRRIIVEFVQDLDAAEKTLAEIDSADVRLPLHIGLVRLDVDADGQASVDEALWKVLARIMGPRIDQGTAEGFVVALDLGDVHWLRGYCHLLQAACNAFLAYDTQELHDLTAQLFFPTATVRYEFLKDDTGRIWGNIGDILAFIHLQRLPVVEPARMSRAREHLLATIEQSRQSWQAILAETDDEHEWIPNPRQKNAAVPFVQIDDEIVAQWGKVTDELELILKGERLAPFWRGSKKQGVNIRRVFEEPRTFDLVLWIQGSAAGPYLEEGEQTSPQLWRETMQLFRGQFFMFALWVN
ncbi:MAG: hypothetical protein KF688_18170 [Pirellulales bacterium]|nr:hypothetical protein [Pirellulales bacterium]